MDVNAIDWKGSQTITRGTEYAISRCPILNRVYWRYSPTFYEWRIGCSVNNTAPLNLLKIVWVNPEQMSKFSGRSGLIYDRWEDIGKIKDGNWDKRLPPDLVNKDADYRENLFFGSTIEETIQYQSFDAHFTDGTSWENTELFQRFLTGINNGRSVWKGCQSKNDLFQRCQHMDELYQKIQNKGFKTQLELFEEDGLKPHHVGFLDLLTDEITVDIGRKGELLFVDGRHRLCIAKILNLDAIPVFILVRHQKWFEKRERIYQTNNFDSVQHPDIAE